MKCVRLKSEMYYLNKIVGVLVSPLGGAVAGAIIVTVCVRMGRDRLAKWLGLTTIIWLWLWMTSVMTFVVGVPLESEFLVDGKVPKVETFPNVEAIVLLGGGMGVETNLSSYAEMYAGADRAWQAGRLYKAARAQRIVATGDIAESSTLDLLLDFGVAREDISFMPARNTEEEAKGIAEKGFRKILLVTSAWHMKRARLMFEKYAPSIEVVCAPADFENSIVAARGASLMPDCNVFALNSVAFHEWVGIIGYTIFR